MAGGKVSRCGAVYRTVAATKSIAWKLQQAPAAGDQRSQQHPPIAGFRRDCPFRVWQFDDVREGAQARPVAVTGEIYDPYQGE